MKKIGKKGKVIVFFALFLLVTPLIVYSVFGDKINFDLRSSADLGLPERFQKADLNKDGKVDLVDFSEWLRLWRMYKEIPNTRVDREEITAFCNEYEGKLTNYPILTCTIYGLAPIQQPKYDSEVVKKSCEDLYGVYEVQYGCIEGPSGVMKCPDGQPPRCTFSEVIISPPENVWVADLNNDNKVSLADFNIWLNLWREYKKYVKEEEDPAKTITKTKDGFTMKATHQGGNKWNYEIIGTLPDTCTVGNVKVTSPSASARNSVGIDLNISESDEICTQVIQEFKKSGSFEHSLGESIGIIFTVNFDKEDSVITKTVRKDNFTLTATYKGGESWDYKIIGQVPNSCYKIANVQLGSLVAIGPNPSEIITFRVEIESPDPTEVCIQQTKYVSKQGTFKSTFIPDRTNLDLYINWKSSLVRRVTQDFLTLETTYKGNKTWDYRIVARFPNSCYKLGETKHISAVLENYQPSVSYETITFQVGVTLPMAGQVCAETIKYQSLNGTVEGRFLPDRTIFLLQPMMPYPIELKDRTSTENDSSSNPDSSDTANG